LILTLWFKEVNVTSDEGHAVTFPAAESYRRPLTGTRLCCLTSRVWNKLLA